MNARLNSLYPFPGINANADAIKRVGNDDLPIESPHSIFHSIGGIVFKSKANLVGKFQVSTAPFLFI